MKIKIQTKHTPLGEYEIACPGFYGDGSPALEVWGEEPQFRATVCIPEIAPAKGNVLIKDYSENEGVMKALIGAGIIKEPVTEHPTGFVGVYECPLTDIGMTLVYK